MVPVRPLVHCVEIEAALYDLVSIAIFVESVMNVSIGRMEIKKVDSYSFIRQCFEGGRHVSLTC
jgi:hypothetical protein